MNDEVKIQTELQQTLKWYGIIGGSCLSAILVVGIWFNFNQVETKVVIEKLKGQFYYLNKDVKEHLDKEH